MRGTRGLQACGQVRTQEMDLSGPERRKQPTSKSWLPSFPLNARTNTCGTLLSLFVYGIVVAAAAAAVDATADQIIFQHRCSQFSFSHFRDILPVYVSFFLQSRDQCPPPKAERPLTCPSKLILYSSPPRISV